MKFNQQNLTGVEVVSVIGSIDALTANEVEQYFNQLTGQGIQNIVIDLQLVDFMSSAGLRVILAISKTVRNMGGGLRIASAKPSVKKMLEISGFTGILKYFSSVEAAVESFNPA